MNLFNSEKESITAEDNGKERKNLFLRLKDQLSRTRLNFVDKLDELVLGKKEIDEDILENLEEILITSDIGTQTTCEIIRAVEEKINRLQLIDPKEIKTGIISEMQKFLMIPPPHAEDKDLGDKKPFVIMIVGVNGVGKTTTIAKLAKKYKDMGKKVLLVAGDTFRAAAIEQLELWAKRVDVDIVKQQMGADPSAVVFDAMDAAISRDMDIVIIDTAGRLHTKVNLMEELKKIHRILGKRMDGAPHDVLLVLDATTGQNAIAQAKIFNSKIGVSGLIITKLDGTAKGGIVIGISNELKIPVRYIGIGEHMNDLREFSSEDFLKAIF